MPTAENTDDQWSLKLYGIFISSNRSSEDCDFYIEKPIARRAAAHHFEPGALAKDSGL